MKALTLAEKLDVLGRLRDRIEKATDALHADPTDENANRYRRAVKAYGRQKARWRVGQ